MSFPTASQTCSPPSPPPQPIEPPILLQSERHKTYYESTRLARRRYEHATLREGLQRGLSLWSILAILSGGGREDAHAPYRGRRLHPSRVTSHSHGHRLEDRSIGCESTAMHYAHTHTHTHNDPPLERHAHHPSLTMFSSSSSHPQSQLPIHHRSTIGYSTSSSSSHNTTPAPPRLPHHHHHNHHIQIPNHRNQHFPTPTPTPTQTHDHPPRNKINPLLTLTINPPLITPDSSYFARVSDYRVRSRKRPWEGDRSWDRSFLCRAYKRRRGGGGGGGGSGSLGIGFGGNGRRVRGGGAVVLERGMVWEMGACGSGGGMGEGEGDWEGDGLGEANGDGDAGRWRYWVPV
ncbi:hypothetical protein ASPACDRAFT_38453 [Aspergillus aculeatus ATCC 16872]|uniref:Uncharacterized protein n=1 Tax=Aspergillus aculeatus (strain ATCC 16872 / CBS 172.66 / WB 5094) TaxID=690307 RepID=A0A1L9X8X8_ASPA1|nr:uncharacterized protein ASPACDRAFT_38453 [Aspergillus aculeatus ATCC 16872]OJK04893.1 hypothetical protein ASPACDRAFT_38453 [Aspergillus aculeatus ATCC 16872]